MDFDNVANEELKNQKTALEQQVRWLLQKNVEDDQRRKELREVNEALQKENAELRRKLEAAEGVAIVPRYYIEGEHEAEKLHRFELGGEGATFNCCEPSPFRKLERLTRVPLILWQAAGFVVEGVLTSSALSTMRAADYDEGRCLASEVMIGAGVSRREVDHVR